MQQAPRFRLQSNERLAHPLVLGLVANTAHVEVRHALPKPQQPLDQFRGPAQEASTCLPYRSMPSHFSVTAWVSVRPSTRALST